MTEKLVEGFGEGLSCLAGNRFAAIINPPRRRQVEGLEQLVAFLEVASELRKKEVGRISTRL